MSKLAVSCVQISGEQRCVSLAGTNHHRLWHELCHSPVTLSQRTDTEAHLWLHTDDGAGEKPPLRLNSGSLPFAQTHWTAFFRVESSSTVFICSQDIPETLKYAKRSSYWAAQAGRVGGGEGCPLRLPRGQPAPPVNNWHHISSQITKLKTNV